MKKLIIGIILILLLASQAQAAKKTVIESKLILSEHGWLGEHLGWGDRYYRITYNDGTSIVQRVRSGGIVPAYITRAPARVEIPVGGDPSGKFKIPVGIQGVSCTLSGSTSGNLHYLEFSYVGSGGYNAVIGGLYLIVPCGKIDNYFPYVDNYYIGAIKNTPGDYDLKLTETVKLSSGMVVTDNRLFTVRVIGTAGTPTPTSTPQSVGTIRVSSNIAGSVYIDGVMKGISGNSFSVDAGGHDVKVSQNGYTTYTRTVTVDNGATIDVFATLTKIPIGTPTPTPEIGQGSITVKSNVLGTVFIDGINKGATGNTYDVDAGGHDIRVTAPGYGSYSTSITVDYGTTKVVEVTLTAVSTGGGGGSTGDATATATPATTSSVDITYGAGSKDITYRGVDIRSEDGIYYVGDIPHDSIAEARNTIDEMIAGKERAKSPGFEAVFAIAGLVAVAYLVLRKKP